MSDSTARGRFHFHVNGSPELISISVKAGPAGHGTSPFPPFSIYHLETDLLEGIGMGHYCRICGRERPNEQFSGKGHRIHVCKRCKAMPKSRRQVIENLDDIFRFMRQSHISEKNVVRLEKMVKSEDPQVASQAAIVLKVAKVKPYKARRLRFLAQRHPELLQQLQDAGLILAYSWDSETADLPADANSEETEISVGTDSEAIDLSGYDDWEIPF
jgi:hypothetical protein